jgi:hypothetical protein
LPVWYGYTLAEAIYKQSGVFYKKAREGNIMDIITSPGKFEGCLKSTPDYWEQALEGAYDMDVDYGGDYFYVFILTNEDREALGADQSDYSLWLHEDNWGFVHEQLMDKHTHNNFMRQAEKSVIKAAMDF